jgi:lipopolysaccharide biosynthesis glycosyltransferase
MTVWMALVHEAPAASEYTDRYALTSSLRSVAARPKRVPERFVTLGACRKTEVARAGRNTMAEEPITVAIAADRRYARQLAVALAGISRTASARSCRIFMLQDGYDDSLRARVLESAHGDIEVHWLDANPEMLSRMATVPEGLTPATFFDLRIEDLVPEEIQRVIYMDSDVIVRESIAELWERDLGGGLLGAVRDPVLPWAASALEWKELGLAPDMPYFNSGMLVIPLFRWRALEVSRRALELLGSHDFPLADQDALNAIVAGNWTALEPRWNLQGGHLTGEGSLAWVTERAEDVAGALDKPAIIHLNHGFWPRPWEPNSTHPYRGEWLEELDRTAWAGWRPRRRGTARRVAGRLRRSGRVLLGN